MAIKRVIFWTSFLFLLGIRGGICHATCGFLHSFLFRIGF